MNKTNPRTASKLNLASALVFLLAGGSAQAQSRFFSFNDPVGDMLSGGAIDGHLADQWCRSMGDAQTPVLE